MKVFAADGTAVELLDQHFLAQGGQASVFTFDNVAYKIFERASDTPSVAKVDELRAIGHSAVVAPTHLVFDSAGRPVGYQMPLVEEGVPLAQLSTLAYQRRTGFTLSDALRLFDELADLLHEIHRHNVVVVDLSDANILMTPHGLRMIDTDSWQTPSAAATAITDTIRDPQLGPKTQHFDPGNDWFALAVVMFAVLVGVHPFKGKHPTVRGLGARMQAGLSVLDPDVRLPAGFSTAFLPSPLRAWFEQTFSTKARHPPPRVRDSHIPPRLRAHPETTGDTLDYRDPPRVVASVAGVLLAATMSGLYAGRRRIAEIADGALAVGLLPAGIPYVVRRDVNGCAEITIHGRSNERIATQFAVDAISQAGEQVFFLQRDRLSELHVQTVGRRTFATLSAPRAVVPNARQLFAGVLIQRLGRATTATLLGVGRAAPQVRLEQLDGALIVDACHHANVLVVLVATEGRYDRHTYVFPAPRARSAVMLRCERDIPPRATTDATDKRGRIVAPYGDGWASFTRGDAASKRAPRPDPAVCGEAVVAHSGRVFTLTESQLRHVSLSGSTATRQSSSKSSSIVGLPRAVRPS